MAGSPKPLWQNSFYRKAGVNAVLVHSAPDLKAVWDNLAFSISLYAGQMCTAPQNIFLPTQGITDASGQHHSYQDLVDGLSQALRKIKDHPQMAPGFWRRSKFQNHGTHPFHARAGRRCRLLASEPIAHEAFPMPCPVRPCWSKPTWTARTGLGPSNLVRSPL